MPFGARRYGVIQRSTSVNVEALGPRLFEVPHDRCVGMRLAELQLRIVWEEILKRFENIEVVGEPKRVYSSFVKGYETLPVKIT